jgi:hypothetical protein
MKETSDVWFSSFLLLHGHSVQDFEIISPNKGKFRFKIDDEEWKRMRILFGCSETSKIKMLQISLKDLLH